MIHQLSVIVFCTCLDEISDLEFKLPMIFRNSCSIIDLSPYEGADFQSVRRGVYIEILGR